MLGLVLTYRIGGFGCLPNQELTPKLSHGDRFCSPCFVANYNDLTRPRIRRWSLISGVEFVK